jgi:hypothetical protein
MIRPDLLLNITIKTFLYLRLFIILLAAFLSPAVTLRAQVTVSGTVLDISKLNYVENVRVTSTGGRATVTDSLGRYKIMVNEEDSLSFIYNNKPTQKFAVRAIPNPYQFDISLRIPVKSKYSVLKEVVIYAKSYKQDSIQNRQDYADVFNYKKPGVSTSITPGGGVGADINELINIFRFKRNKRLKAFQRRLEDQEKEHYISSRFNRTMITRITGLTDTPLDTFMVWYRPPYDFTQQADETMFNQYVLNAYYQFRKIYTVPAKKEDGSP